MGLNYGLKIRFFVEIPMPIAVVQHKYGTEQQAGHKDVQ
jgi:hypothetical protein